MREVSVKIAYRFPNQNSYPLTMHSFNQTTRKWYTLYDDGTIQSDPPITPKTVLKVVLTSIESFPEKLAGNLDAKEFAGKKRPFTRLRYIHADDEANIASPSEKLQNYIKRKTHEFLCTHQNVFVVGMDGSNQNANLGSSPLVDLIDETMHIRQEKATNDVISKYRVVMEGIYKSDKDTFVDLAYACDIPNIKDIGYSESLYNKMISFIDNKPFEFEKVYNSNQRSLLALVNRALYTEVDGRQTAIEQKAGYYMFNNFAAAKIEGKDRSNLLNYFNANPEAMHQLEQKMGVFVPRQELKKMPEPVEVKEEVLPDVDAEKVLKLEKIKEGQIKQQILTTTHKLSIKKEISDKDWEKYMADINALKEKYPIKSTFIDETSDTICKNFKLENPYRKFLIRTEATQ